MKVLLTVLLFISAAAAINNLVGLPDETFDKVEHLLKDSPLSTDPSKFDAPAGLGSLLKDAKLSDVDAPSIGLDDDGGSGVNPGGPDDVKKAVQNIVDSLRTIIPAIKTLKEARDRQNRVYAAQFVAVLRNPFVENEHVKAVLGSHVIALHRRCMAIKLAFAKHAHQTGLLDALSNDDLDFTEVMEKVLEWAEHHEADAFEAFVHMANKHKIQNHPGVKVIMAVGGLVAEAACEVKMDGLAKKIGEFIEEGDPHGDFGMSLGDKVISFLYNKKNKKCSGDLVESLKPGKGLKERILSLIFGRCQEVRLVRYAVDTVMDAIQLGKRVAVLQSLAHKRTMKMAFKVGSLMHSGLINEAHELVGEFVLEEMRRGFLVGLAVQKSLESSGPRPTGPSPSRPRPSGGTPSRPRPSGGPTPSSSQQVKRSPSFIEDALMVYSRGKPAGAKSLRKE